MPQSGVAGPTHLMQRASIVIEQHPHELTKSALAAAVGGRKQSALRAINGLITGGVRGDDAGRQGARRLRFAPTLPTRFSVPKRPGTGSQLRELKEWARGTASTREPLGTTGNRCASTHCFSLPG